MANWKVASISVTVAKAKPTKAVLGDWLLKAKARVKVQSANIRQA